MARVTRRFFLLSSAVPAGEGGRDSRGSYDVEDSLIVQPYDESGFRWELVEWS